MGTLTNCILFFGCILGAPSALNAISPSPSSTGPAQDSLPWLTGPLIAPPGTAVPYGDFMIKSYLYSTANTGAYDQHWRAVSSEDNFYSLSAQFQSFFGITPWCDLNIIPQVLYNNTSGEHSFQFGDLTIGLDFQLMEAERTPYFPGIKFAVREIFPTGNFQLFHPKKLGTDQSGMGTFATQCALVFYKTFHMKNLHWLSTTLSIQYTVNTPIHVHGFNSYGGGFGTRGTVIGGNSFQGIASFEFTLNRNWAVALDSVYTQTDPTQFFGLPGISLQGTYAEVGKPSLMQLSFAPALEYNFDPNLGVIAGCWFSALGKNSAVFRSGVVNVKYTY